MVSLLDAARGRQKAQDEVVGQATRRVQKDIILGPHVGLRKAQDGPGLAARPGRCIGVALRGEALQDFAGFGAHVGYVAC